MRKSLQVFVNEPTSWYVSQHADGAFCIISSRRSVEIGTRLVNGRDSGTDTGVQGSDEVLQGR